MSGKPPLSHAPASGIPAPDGPRLARRPLVCGALSTLALSLAAPARAATSATPAPKGPAPAGRWQVEDIRGGGVIDRARTVLEIDPGGRVSGSGGCNRLSARALVSGQNISFALVATTRMACPAAVMGQEQRFLAALAEVRAWHADPATHKLFLTAADGTPLLELAAL